MKLFPHPKRTKSRLLEEFKDKRILDLSRRSSNNIKKALHEQRPNFHTSAEINHDLTQFPWPIPDNTYDLILCQNILQHLPNTVKTMEELNRITLGGGKVFLECPHYTWFEAYRHFDHCHRFSFGSFDFFVKGNPFYKTDFQMENKYLYFDDLTFMLGIGFLANLFPRTYEKRLAFIFPATSFQITFQVDK